MVMSLPDTVKEPGPLTTLSVWLIKNSPLTNTLTGAVTVPRAVNITDDGSVP